MMRNQVYFSLHVLNLKLPAKFHLMRQITLTVMYGDLDVMNFWKYAEGVVLYCLILRELCFPFPFFLCHCDLWWDQGSLVCGSHNYLRARFLGCYDPVDCHLPSLYPKYTKQCLINSRNLLTTTPGLRPARRDREPREKWCQAIYACSLEPSQNSCPVDVQYLYSVS